MMNFGDPLPPGDMPIVMTAEQAPNTPGVRIWLEILDGRVIVNAKGLSPLMPLLVRPGDHLVFDVQVAPKNGASVVFTSTLHCVRRNLDDAKPD